MTTGENAAGFVAQRHAVVGFLRALPDEHWTPEVLEEVATIIAAYRDTLLGDLDETTADAVPTGELGPSAVHSSPAELVESLDGVGARLEASYAESSEARWEGPTAGLRTGHPIGIGVQTLLYDVHRRVHRIGDLTGIPFQPPPEATAAVAAAVAWRVGGHVEVPTRVVVGDDEYMVGAGEPEATLRTDHDAIVAVATGRAAPADLRQEGRWEVEAADDEAREAVDRSFSADWGDPEVGVAGR